MDHIRVLLVFRAHQPICSPRRLAASALGRLVAVAEALGAPIGLAVSNELAHQLRRDLPQTFAELRRGYVERRLRPVYTLAHQTPVALLQPGEIDDELRLNRECVERLIGAPAPRQVGVLPSSLPAGLEPHGVDFTFARPPAGRASAFRLGRRLVALPLALLEPTPDEEHLRRQVLAHLDATPPGGVLTFLHELAELEVVRRLWGELVARVEITGADEILASGAVTGAAPEVVPAAEPTPLAEAGLTGALEWLVEAFGFARTPPLGADALFDEDYQIERLPPRAQVPMLLRLVKAGCALPLEVEEALARRPFLHGYRLCDALRAECRLIDTRPVPARGLPSEVLPGLARVVEVILEPRVAYREVELERLQDLGARVELQGARRAQAHAVEAVDGVRLAYGELALHGFRGRRRWRALVERLRDHLGCICVALDHLERAAVVQRTNVTGQR